MQNFFCEKQFVMKYKYIEVTVEFNTS